MRNFLTALNPARLTGPIFTKELRVASRRRRNYVLRLAYVTMLLLFVGGVWAGGAEWTDASGANIVYQMSQMGASIVTTIAWFQFCTLQLVAVVLASTSINQEVYARSLGVLMTTPVTPWQIVFGKVLSKMAQLAVLLAISMPALALVRVFGGVPWDYVLSTTCVTITAALFAASISMFYSSVVRPPYAVILLTLGTMFILYVIVMWFVGLAMMLFATVIGLSNSTFLSFASCNPFAVMGLLTLEMYRPGAVSPPWIVNCCLMLVMSIGLLSLTVPLVRRKALRSALGGTPSYTVAMPAPAPPPMRAIVIEPPANPPCAQAIAPAGPAAPPPPPMPPPIPQAVLAQSRAAENQYRQQLAIQGYRLRKLRTIPDDPIFWREVHTPLFRSAVWRWVLFGLAMAILFPLYLGTAAVAATGNGLRPVFHSIFCGVFALCATACTVIVSATGVTSEKESGSLPLILTTPLSDTSILLGKAAGVVRRCLPVWGFLFAHALGFSVFLATNPLIVLHMILIAGGTIVFLTGSGLYCGCRFRKTTAAVVVNMGMALAMWALLPIASAMFGGNESGWTSLMNPVYQAGDLAGWAGDHSLASSHTGNSDFAKGGGAIGTTATAIFFSAAYVASGAILFWRARYHLRRNVY